MRLWLLLIVLSIVNAEPCTLLNGTIITSLEGYLCKECSYNGYPVSPGICECIEPQMISDEACFDTGP